MAAIKTLAGRSMAWIEERAIRDTLERTRGNRAKAAAMLGIGERSLYRKLKDYGINRRHMNNFAPRARLALKQDDEVRTVLRSPIKGKVRSPVRPSPPAAPDPLPQGEREHRRATMRSGTGGP